MSGKELTRFVSSLDACTSLDEGFQALSKSISAMGFDGIAYTAIPQSLGTMQPVFLASVDFSIGFLNHYAEAELHVHDFSISRALQGETLPLDWQEESRTGLLTPAQLDVIRLASSDYHIQNAFTIPTLCDAHIIAGSTITSEASRAQFELLKAMHFQTLQSMVTLFHHFVFNHPRNRHMFYDPFLSNLTRDELLVIELIIDGRPLKQAQSRFGISQTRAGNILSDLYKRLNIRKGHQLCYLFGRHMVLEMLDERNNTNNELSSHTN